MQKLLFLFCGLCLLACTNQSSDTAGNKDSAANGAATNATGTLTNDALSFLSPCVDNAKASLGEQQAYALCKCMYNQVQQQHPNEDSTTLLKHLSDTAEVASLAKNCK